MKILLLKNKISKSYKPKIEEVKKFFGNIELDFTEEKTNLKIVNGKYNYFNGKGELKEYEAVDETWYDENISKPAKARGFDIVIFIIPKKNWISEIVDGFGTATPDFGIEEIAVKELTGDTYSFTDGVKNVYLNGDNMTWTIIHELLHRIYNIKGLKDNTHKYFLEGKPEKCLEDFKMKTWKYFKPEEKTGSLGHTIADLEPSFVDMIDKLRDICGFPFVGTSGYRTVEENKKVGGVPNSAHIKRLAIDIACTDPHKRLIIAGEAYKMGFIGIGIDKEFVHLDMDTSNPREMWTYK